MRGYECFGHTHRTLVPVESHHVWPLGYHGPNTPANRRDACANAHSDTHYLLERMLKTGDKVPTPEKRTYGFGVRRVAKIGYVAVMAYAQTLADERTP